MIDRHIPPGAEILARFLPSNIEEGVLGDLDESFYRIAAVRGRLFAQIWYVTQIVSLSLIFFLFNLQTLEHWRIPVNRNFFVRGSRWTALAGSFALLPSLFVVAIGLMFSFGSRELGDLLLTRVYSDEWYWRIAHPVNVLGGLIAAFLVNSFSVTTFDVHRTKEEVGLSLNVRKSALNLGVMATAAITLLILMVYAFGENLSYLL